MWVSKYLRPRAIAILGLMCNVIVQMYQLFFKYAISAGIIAPMPPNKKNGELCCSPFTCSLIKAYCSTVVVS